MKHRAKTVGDAIDYSTKRLSKDICALKFIPPEGFSHAARDIEELHGLLTAILGDSEVGLEDGHPGMLVQLIDRINDWIKRPLLLSERLALRQLLDQYDHVEWGYEGSFSGVFKAITFDGEQVALKIPKPWNNYAESVFKAEMEAHVDLKKIGHQENLIQIHGSRLTPYFCLQMEWLSGSSLKEYCEFEGGPIMYKDALLVAMGVARGIRAAHEMGRVHLDIHPQNIMFRGATIKSAPVLIDWGLSSMETPDGTMSYADQFRLNKQPSPEYAAPEQLDQQFGLPCKKTDVYRLALITYELLTASGPENRRLRRTKDMSVNFDLKPPSMHDVAGLPIPQEVDDLLMDGLQKQVKDRSTLNSFGGGIAEILNVRW